MSRFNCFIALMLAMLLTGAGACVSATAADDPAQSQIRAALTQWTADFNAARGDKVCALFAPDLRATVRGRAERGFG